MKINTSKNIIVTENNFLKKTLKVIGGMPPYTWKTKSSLPNNIALTKSGVLKGTAKEVGNFNIIVKVIDSIGTVAKKIFNLQVLPTTTTTTPNPALLSVIYNNNANVSGSGTIQDPYLVMIVDNSLPLAIEFSVPKNGNCFYEFVGVGIPYYIEPGHLLNTGIVTVASPQYLTWQYYLPFNNYLESSISKNDNFYIYKEYSVFLELNQSIPHTNPVWNSTSTSFSLWFVPDL